MANFEKYLDVQIDTIERPTAAPLGHYFATFKSWKTAQRDYKKASGGPKVDVVELTFTITGADEDAEAEDAVAAAKAVGRLGTKDYTLGEEQGMYALRRFASDVCGIDTKGLTVSEGLDAAKGSDVKLYNQPRSGNEEGVFYDNFTKILPANSPTS